jgi:hypothetical protein
MHDIHTRVKVPLGTPTGILGCSHRGAWLDVRRNTCVEYLEKLTCRADAAIRPESNMS